MEWISLLNNDNKEMKIMQKSLVVHSVQGQCIK